MRRAVWKESGQSLVEFALVFPVLLLLILGATQLVLLMANKMALENAAFEAVRSAAVKVGKDPREARREAEGIVADRTRMTMVGPGLLVRPVKVKSLRVQEGEVMLTVEGRVELLPLLKQAFWSTGVRREVALSSTATAKKEPYTGE
ncbi:MAG: pilus assembly protein [Actinobacteria bacterium]|nr:pilus assembly protein [Actinomycetota bacterium]